MTEYTSRSYKYIILKRKASSSRRASSNDGKQHNSAGRSKKYSFYLATLDGIKQPRLNTVKFTMLRDPKYSKYLLKVR